MTLLKDFSSIALKKFDLDFAVDPLFKKTSADFDEGGARGLLLNHLSIDQYCKIIFDASDATIDCDTEELDGEITTVEKNIPQEETEVADDPEDTDSPNEEGTDEEDSPMEEAVEETSLADRSTHEEAENVESMDIDKPTNSPMVEETVESTDSESRVEISRLKARLPTMEVLEGLNIIPSLKGFDFFSENDLEIPTLDHDDDLPFEHPTEEHNAFQFDDYGDDGGDFGVDDMDPFAIEDNGDQDQHNEELDNTEKAYPEPDFLTAMLNNGDQVFNYFDSTLQNWAGAEHWKLRRPPPATKCKEKKKKENWL